MRGSEEDPKGLIREAYRIDGIGAAECRTVFLDWALSLSDGQDSLRILPVLLERYGSSHPDHPMTGVLTEGLAQGRTPKRRGGWRTRPRD